MEDDIIDDLNREIDEATQEQDFAFDAERMAQRAEELLATSEDLIRRYPVQSVLIGFGVGYILGRLLGSDD